MMSILDRKILIFTLAILASVNALSKAQAASLTSISPTNIYYVQLTTVSDDGQVVAGRLYDFSSNSSAFTWSNGNTTSISAPLTYSSPLFNKISANGTVIVGDVVDSNGYSQPIYFQNSSFYNLNVLATNYSGQALGVNGDGSVIVGYNVDNASSAYTHAVTWTNGIISELSTFVGDKGAAASAVDYDGNIIAGTEYDSSFHTHAVIWDHTVIQALSELPSDTDTIVNDISNDGSVVVGQGLDTSYNSHARRWENNSVIDLGGLPGGSASIATAISGDGTTAVGQANDSNGVDYAVRWIGSNPTEKLSDVLIAKGVDLTGWNLASASDVNIDGNVIVGIANLNGDNVGYIANLATGGLTTPQALGASLQSTIAASQQANQGSLSSLGQSLFTAEHLNLLSVAAVQPATPMSSIAPTPSSPVVTHPDGSQSFTIKDENSSYGMITPYEPSLLSRLSVYTVGSIGAGQNNNFDNHDVNGTVGASVRMNHDISVGVGVLGANSHTNMAFDGKSDLSARGVSTVFSYAPRTGFRVFGTAFLADLDLTINRGYMNGNTQSGSRGTPNGNAHGIAAEFGYAVPLNKQMMLTPFLDSRWSRTSVDAYDEIGGPFNASYSTQKDTNVTSHLGSELSYQLNQKVGVYTRLAWAHRLSGDSASFTAASSGITQTLGLDPGDKDWAEGTVGANFLASEKIRLSAELSGRTGVTQEPVTTLTFGANISF